MKDFLLQLVSDEKGNISSARVINLMIAICGCLISWKLVIMGGFNEAYFGLLMAYGGGVYGFGKAQEAKNVAVSVPARSRVKDEDEDSDPSLKPPKE